MKFARAKNYLNPSVKIIVKTILTCLVILIPLFVQFNSAEAAIRPVVIEGEAAPGFDSGATFYNLNACKISINNTGQTAFYATVQSDSNNYNTLWQENAGSLSLMHQSDERPPGLSGDVAFEYFGIPNINDSGMVAFDAYLTGNDVQHPESDYGVWKGVPGSVSLVARAGDIAPGTSGDTFGNGFSSFQQDSVVINDSGKVAFLNALNNIPLDGGAIFQETGSGLTLIAKIGGPVPGVSDTVYSLFNMNTPALNENGALPIVASIFCNSGNCITWGSDPTDRAYLIQMSVNGSISMKYKEYTSAPGIPGGDFFSFLSAETNASGNLAFQATVSGENFTSLNNTGLWSDASGSLSLIARLGSQAPGTPAGAVFGTFNRGIAMNNSGLMVFGAALKTDAGGVDYTNNEGMWYGTAGNLKLIARKGDQAVGLENGMVFNAFSSYAINDSGQVCMIASATGTISHNGIWLYDPSNGLSLIVVEGDEMTLTTGETVTFDTIPYGPSGLSYSGGADGRARFFNNNGEIVFNAMLSDYREGFFIANTSGSAPTPDLTADAGADQSVTEGDTVNLDASGSSATASTIATYSWAQTDSSGISVSLSDSTAISPTFTAPQVDSATTLVFTLTVTSNIGATDTDTVSITITDSSSGGGGTDNGDSGDDSSSSGCFISNLQTYIF